MLIRWLLPGNGHSAAPAPDSGPEPGTGRRASRIHPANLARCTVTRPRRNASTAAGCHGSRVRPTQHPVYRYGEGFRGQRRHAHMTNGTAIVPAIVIDLTGTSAR